MLWSSSCVAKFRNRVEPRNSGKITATKKIAYSSMVR